MAHGLFRDKVERQQLSVSIDSAGTSGWHAGEQPDKRAQAKMREYSIDISDLRSRPFQATDFRNFDRIFAMDTSNFSNLSELATSSEDQEKVELLLDLTYPGEERSVPDPYYGSSDGFQAVYDLLDEALDKLITQVRSE